MSTWNWIVDLAEEWSPVAIVIRMTFALFVGVVIGIDRGLKRRGAGIKTHALVCMGSALVMITSEYMCNNFVDRVDMSRMGAQVISGVGFLGVGTIIVTGKNQVRGLTTAAGLWACACVGLAAGIGFVEGALVTLFLIFLTLRVLSKVDIWLHRYAKVFDLYLEFETNKCISTFIQKMHEKNVKIGTMEISKSQIKGEGPNVIVTIEVPNRKGRPTLLDDIRDMEFVKYVEEL